ncbi:ATP-grasp domain-containing protein [Clostridiisalibacter paucivorans]|uniref:ATP-grasp domain-containing protein n=1 Tax=Clostridiisalibacter paucivorans TaxID=408753 RepID=UPI000478B51A|nr:ATP-grasp domain-containing protein [Clostridiisalibacter paucivorans]
MRLLILGGGSCQINSILKAKSKGVEVIVSDYYDDAVGKEYSDFGELVSTFDAKGNIEVAKKYDIDGIMTVGTDQPIYTVARVAEAVKIPSFLDVDTAKAVTNKKIMKKIFVENDIPTTKYRLLEENFCENDLQGLNFPVVMKPLDSQGQRGIYKIHSINGIRDNIRDTLSYSREDKIIVEEYYENDEITVSGWVKDGKTKIILVTDRVTYNDDVHIGVCIAHHFPSKHLKGYYHQIKEITEKLVRAFSIKNGPIYFQMLIGKEGIKVNEIACRLGGAYEDKLIPRITGIDVLEMVIDYSLGKNVDYTALDNYDIENNDRYGAVQLFFALPGKIKDITSIDKLMDVSGVIDAGCNFKPGDIINSIENATQRAGYMIILGEDKENINNNIDRAFENLKIYDEKGQNLVLKFKECNFN